MKDARNSRYTNSQFFTTFQYFIDLGDAEREYLIQRDIIITLIDFILGQGIFSIKAPESTDTVCINKIILPFLY